MKARAGYEGDAKDQALSDTIISGLASYKIRAKIVKEGHKVKLNWVMEIARLEVSTQQHLERMQETAKVNYIQYGKSTKSKKGKKSTQSGASSHRGNRGHGTSSKPSGKGKKLPFPARHLLQMWERQTPKCTGLQSCGCDMQGLWKERTLWRGVPQETYHKLSRSSTGFHRQGPVNPSTSMMEDNQCIYIWSVSLM